MKKQRYIKIIIYSIILLAILPSYPYSQSNTPEIIEKLKSDNNDTILEGIEDAWPETPNGSIFIALKTVISSTDDNYVKVKAIDLAGSYAVYLNNNSIVTPLWDLIVKPNTDADVAEQCYKSLIKIIPVIGGFNKEYTDLIKPILDGYDDTESHAKGEGIRFFSVIINKHNREDLISDLAEFLSEKTDSILLEATKAYKDLKSKYSENINEGEEYFTKEELKPGGKYLKENLSINNHNIKLYTIKALGNIQFKDKDTIIKLISMLKNETSEIQIECALALGKIGSELAVDSLYKLAWDETNKNLQATAIEALSYIPEQVDIKQISFLKSDLDYKVRENFLKVVVAVIKQTKDKSLVKYLNIPVINNDWEGILVQSAKGYAQIPSKDNLSYLEKLLNYNKSKYDSFVRVSAAKALAKHKYKKSEELLLKRLKKEETTEVIKTTIDALAQLGYETSVTEISKKFKDKNKEIVLIALDAVSRIGGEEAKKLMMDYVKNNPDGNGYDVALTMLQVRLNVDKMDILKETNPAKYYYELAKQSYKNKQYNDVISYINQSLTYDNEYSEAYYLRGITNFSLEEYREALPDFKKSLTLGINDNKIYKALGIISFNLKDYESAVTYFKNYINKTGDNEPEIHLKIAAAQANNLQYEEAIESVNLFLFAKKEDMQGIRMLADIYHLKQDWENAILYMEQYLEEYPNQADAIYQIGIDYLNIENFDKAIESMSRVIDLVQTEYPRAYYFLGIAHLRKLEYKEAERYLKYFLSIADDEKDKLFINKAESFVDKLKDITGGT